MNNTIFTTPRTLLGAGVQQNFTNPLPEQKASPSSSSSEVQVHPGLNLNQKPNVRIGTIDLSNWLKKEQELMQRIGGGIPFLGTPNDIIFNFAVRNALPVKDYNSTNSNVTLEQYRGTLKQFISGDHPLQDMMGRESIMNLSPQELERIYTSPDRMNDLMTDIQRGERYLLDPRNHQTLTYFNSTVRQQIEEQKRRNEESKQENEGTIREGFANHPDQEPTPQEIADQKRKEETKEGLDMINNVRNVHRDIKVYQSLRDPEARIKFGQNVQNSLREKVISYDNKARQFLKKGPSPIAKEGPIVYDETQGGFKRPFSGSSASDGITEPPTKVPKSESLMEEKMIPAESELGGAEGAAVGEELAGAEGVAATSEAAAIGTAGSVLSGAGAVVGAVTIGYDIYKRAGGVYRSPFLEGVNNAMNAVTNTAFGAVNSVGDALGIGNLPRRAEHALAIGTNEAVQELADPFILGQDVSKNLHEHGVKEAAEAAWHDIKDFAVSRYETTKRIFEDIGGGFTDLWNDVKSLPEKMANNF